MENTISEFQMLKIIEIQITNILGILEMMNKKNNKFITKLFEESNFTKLKNDILPYPKG